MRGEKSILARLFVPIMQAGIFFFYLFFILPSYFGSSTSIRMLICLIVHPAVVESLEVTSRFDVASSGEGDTVEAGKLRVLSDSQVHFVSKAFFATCRRVMLLNLGNPSSTILTIVFSSLEEALMRAFLVDIDTGIRKIMGKPELVGRNLKMHRLIWSIDVTQSSIAEFVAIIVSTLAFILLEPHAMAINFGHIPGEEVLFGLIFIQLMIELLLEGIVDAAALWAEHEHGIPVAECFEKTNSMFVFLMHFAGCIGCFFLAFYSFVRYPTIINCPSSNLCDCVEQRQYVHWYSHLCNIFANQTGMPNATNSSVILPVFNYTAENDMFDAVEIGSVLQSVAIFLGVSSALFFAVSYRNYIKRATRITQMKSRLRNMKETFLMPICSVLSSDALQKITKKWKSLC